MATSGRENKSIVDVVGINDEAFPLRKTQTHLLIVGHCTMCGAPIYGPQVVPSGKKPEVEYTCLCRNYQETRPEKRE